MIEPIFNPKTKIARLISTAFHNVMDWASDRYAVFLLGIWIISVWIREHRSKGRTLSMWLAFLLFGGLILAGSNGEYFPYTNLAGLGMVMLIPIRLGAQKYRRIEDRNRPHWKEVLRLGTIAAIAISVFLIGFYGALQLYFYFRYPAF
jgi:4-amino-4-deoxy-L-arabinose transferase-like glycosyltransferase